MFPGGMEFEPSQASGSARRIHVLALKARHSKAQGGKPWEVHSRRASPERAKQLPVSPFV